MFLSLRKKGALNLPLLSTIEEERIDEKFFYSSLAVSFLNNGLKIRKFYLDAYYTHALYIIFLLFFRQMRSQSMILYFFFLLA